jgi:hypothetical protein
MVHVASLNNDAPARYRHCERSEAISFRFGDVEIASLRSQ